MAWDGGEVPPLLTPIAAWPHSGASPPLSMSLPSGAALPVQCVTRPEYSLYVMSKKEVQRAKKKVLFSSQMVGVRRPCKTLEGSELV